MRVVPTDSGASPALRKMRIALVAPPLLPIPPQRYAGTERVVAALAMGLTERGHEVTLFASGDSEPGCRVVPVLSRAVWTRGFRADAGVLMALSAAVVAREAEAFDLIHLHLDVMGLSLQRQLPVPSVTTFHGRLDQEGIFEMVEEYRDVPMVAISASQWRWQPHANWVSTIHHGLALADITSSEVVGSYLVVVGRVRREGDRRSHRGRPAFKAHVADRSRRRTIPMSSHSWTTSSARSLVMVSGSWARSTPACGIRCCVMPGRP